MIEIYFGASPVTRIDGTTPYMFAEVQVALNTFARTIRQADHTFDFEQDKNHALSSTYYSADPYVAGDNTNGALWSDY